MSSFSNQPLEKTADGWLARRIPASLLDAATKGVYHRQNPYTVDAIIEAFASDPFVTRDTRIVTMGSCFAQELAHWLDRYGYRRLPHHWGVIYTPASLRQIVQYSVEPETWRPVEPFWADAAGVYDPYRKSDDHNGALRLGDTIDQARAAWARHQADSRATLAGADLAVLTLGLTELWRNREDHAAFFAVPPPAHYSEARHAFHAMTFDEVRNDLGYVVDRLQRLNPRLRIVFSISPIPLSVSFRTHLGAYVATQESKSVLHAAVHDIIRSRGGVSYMPSYEIATSDRARFFQTDGRHVNAECVATIMGAFERMHVRPSAR